jgi:hypothetical protein
MRLPAVVQARMVLNAALDMLIGLVPILGDLADIGWKANLRNLVCSNATPAQASSPRARRLSLRPRLSRTGRLDRHPARRADRLAAVAAADPLNKKRGQRRSPGPLWCFSSCAGGRARPTGVKR